MFKLFIFFTFLIFPINVHSIEKKIILASTTSTYDSGLLDYLNIKFKEIYNIEVQVLAQGTGQALRTAKDGNVEVLMVHHKESELAFIEDGYGEFRYDLMYNDYIIVGPLNDRFDCKNIQLKLKEIFFNKSKFVSRGDDSGTHKKEIELLKFSNINIIETLDNYIEVGQGMGNTLLIANEIGAYTLTDRSTWISFNKKDNLKIICESHPPLVNQYGVILVKESINSQLDIESARTYINWLISEDGKKLINSYRKKDQQLFYFNYK